MVILFGYDCRWKTSLVCLGWRYVYVVLVINFCSIFVCFFLIGILIIEIKWTFWSVTKSNCIQERNHNNTHVYACQRWMMEELNTLFYNTICSGCCGGDLSDIECHSFSLYPVILFALVFVNIHLLKTKNFVVWKKPFNHNFSKNCSQWHAPKNARQTPDSTGFNCCKACKQLIHNMRQLQRSSEN